MVLRQLPALDAGHRPQRDLPVDGHDVGLQPEVHTDRTSDNITAQITNDLRARLAYNYNNVKRENLLPAIDGSGSPTANYAIGNKTPNYSVSGNVDYVINSSWFAGVRGGYYSSDTSTSGVYDGTRFLFNGTTNIGMPGVPPSLQRATNFANVPTNRRRRRTTRRA